MNTKNFFDFSIREIYSEGYFKGEVILLEGNILCIYSRNSHGNKDIFYIYEISINKDNNKIFIKSTYAYLVVLGKSSLVNFSLMKNGFILCSQEEKILILELVKKNEKEIETIDNNNEKIISKEIKLFCKCEYKISENIIENRNKIENIIELSNGLLLVSDDKEIITIRKKNEQEKKFKYDIMKEINIGFSPSLAIEINQNIFMLHNKQQQKIIFYSSSDSSYIYEINKIKQNRFKLISDDYLLSFGQKTKYLELISLITKQIITKIEIDNFNRNPIIDSAIYYKSNNNNNIFSVLLLREQLLITEIFINKENNYVEEFSKVLPKGKKFKKILPLNKNLNEFLIVSNFDLYMITNKHYYNITYGTFVVAFTVFSFFLLIIKKISLIFFGLLVFPLIFSYFRKKDKKMFDEILYGKDKERNIIFSIILLLIIFVTLLDIESLFFCLLIIISFSVFFYMEGVKFEIESIRR